MFSDERLYIGMSSMANNDLIEVKLLQPASLDSSLTVRHNARFRIRQELVTNPSSASPSVTIRFVDKSLNVAYGFDVL